MLISKCISVLMFFVFVLILNIFLLKTINMEAPKKKTPNRTNKPLIVELDAALIRKIKVMAFEQDTTMKKLVLHAIKHTYGL